MNTKIKIEVLKTMAEASPSSADRYEIRKRLEILQDEEFRDSERQQTWMLGLILLFLVGILVSLDLNVWKPTTPLSKESTTSHVMDKTLWELISSKPATKADGGHSR